jgi:GNAT superfamily N-acetyltransferase
MLPQLTYRLATLQDLPALTALINAAFAIEKGKFKSQERITANQELEDYFARGVFLIAETEGEPAQPSRREMPACVFAEILSPPAESRGGGVAYFGLLSVAPQYQRHGLGREMTLRAEAWALAQGCHAMELDTLDVRPELPPIYERMGYRIVSVRPSPVAEWFTQPVKFVRMRKTLKPSPH